MPRRDLPPAVDDFTFEVRPGEVTGLLGAPGAGKTTTLRLMLELDGGRGVTLFDGRPLHEFQRPARAAGVLLGDLPGHPRRSGRGHLRMLAAAFGVPGSRADEVLDIVGLTRVADRRLGTYSHGMSRRLGIAAALLADPRTLILDEPADGLSPRESAWVDLLLRAYAARGRAVLVTGRDPRDMARLADHVITIDDGRLIADQPADEFARTRLRPHVVVRSPHAQRLAGLLAEAGAEVADDGGSRITVYGATADEVGETAYRHGILLHRLDDEVADTGPVDLLCRADGREPTGGPGAGSAARPARVRKAVRPRGPVRALRYELRRFSGVAVSWWVVAASLLASLVGTVALVWSGDASVLRLMSGWIGQLPLPPAAMGAGLLGALAYGQEFRYPALAPVQAPVPRQLRLLAAKLVVSAVAALLLAVAASALDTTVPGLLAAPRSVSLFVHEPAQVALWASIAVGCAWAGLLAAGVFRTAAHGVVAVLAIPVVMVPLVRVIGRPLSGQLVHGASMLRGVDRGWRPTAGEWVLNAARSILVQPVRSAFVLSLAVLLCAYVASVLRDRTR